MHAHRSRSTAFLKVALATALFVLAAGCKKDKNPEPRPPPTSLSYSANPAIYTKGVSIPVNTPTSSGGEVESYSVSPPLPAGLTLNASTGVISGTPTAITAAANYTVTATNTGGSTTAAVAITVNDAAPSNLVYSANPVAYTKDVPIAANTTTSSGGTVVTYTVDALPAGLSLDPSTGAISGTPTAITAAANYTVTATNTGGSTTAAVAITVNDAAPSNLVYLANPAVYSKASPITANTPTSSGGAVLSYSVDPALPAGLSLDASSGVISGTPTVFAKPRSYTVTATSSGGSTSATVSIAVDARLDVLFTTDEHSHLFGFAPELDDSVAPTTAATGEIKIRGGVLRRAAILASERAAASDAGASSITVSAGDISQGTLAAMSFLGTATDITLMSLLGYDAVALGNHEFDTTPDGLAWAIHVASLQGRVPPFVLTNMIFSGDSDDDALELLYGPEEDAKAIAPYRIVIKDGMRIGIVAVMGALAARDAGPFASPVTFSSADPRDREAALSATFAAVQPVVTALRTTHACDVVIVLGHGGIHVPGSIDLGDDERLANGVTGIDLLVSGHTHFAPGTPIYIEDPDHQSVPVLQVAPFGEGVGHAELAVSAAGGVRPAFDAVHSRFVSVDDHTVALGSDFPLIEGAIEQVLGALEDEHEGHASPLELTLSAIEGAPVQHATRGDLYFRPLGHTAFDVPGLGIGETNVANLDTDAMLDTAVALAGTTEIALQNRGSIRADLRAGSTGVLSFADVYAAVALGLDPIDGSPGYPLVRVLIPTGYLRAALEKTLLAATVDPDYQLLPSGLRVEYDPLRAMFDPEHADTTGWITKLALVDRDANETPLYDASFTDTYGWVSDPAAPRSVVTTYQVAAFAASFGIPLIDPSTFAPVDASHVTQLILRRDGGSAVKDYQSLAAYVKALGELPARYDGTTSEGHVPRRVVPCLGGVCP